MPKVQIRKGVEWRNRIVGYGEEVPERLVANPRNWRIHPTYQQKALAGALSEVGWVQDVIVNKRTGFVVDGHLRVALALQTGQKSVPVKYVDLTEEEEAYVLATLDPIVALTGVSANKDVLGELLKNISTEDEAVRRLLDDLHRQAHPLGIAPDNPYTQIVNAIQYLPRGIVPSVAELVDQQEYRKLLKEIEERADKLDPELRQFLELAATRFLTFNYSKIADYYANAEPEVQRLFELLLLVIIDFNDAIVRGVVRINDRIRDLLESEYTDLLD